MAQAHIPYSKTTHKPLTTAHLAQTMSLLEMNNQELAEKIQAEISQNPALEIKKDPRCPSCGRKLVNKLCPSCSKPTSLSADEPIVFVSTRNDFPSYSSGSSYKQEEYDPFEDYSSQTEDLPAYVLNQIRTELKPEDRLIAAHILTSLDDNGLLPIPTVEIAMYHHIPISRVDAVRELIKRSEPYGVGAHTSQEALIVQLEVLKENGRKVPNHAKKALEDGFKELTQNNLRDLCKAIDISMPQAEQVSKFITENLNPFPAHAYWGTHRNQTNDAPDRYQDPDIIISYQGDKKKPQLVVEILWPIQGNLGVNAMFRKEIAKLPNDQSQELNKEYQKANLLIKCLSQRNHTLVQLMQKLAQEQRQYIIQGDLHMKPLTRASLAEELDVHESTISRAVSSKSVQLPSGKIVPVAQFFDRSLHIRTLIKQIIAAEKKPLSDTKITKILEEEHGLSIARRTVAKYRTMEGILPAHLRKKIKG